jgi:hypothetical protein
MSTKSPAGIQLGPVGTSEVTTGYRTGMVEQRNSNRAVPADSNAQHALSRRIAMDDSELGCDDAGVGVTGRRDADIQEFSYDTTRRGRLSISWRIRLLAPKPKVFNSLD